MKNVINMRKIIILFLIMSFGILKSQKPSDAILVSYRDTEDALEYLTSIGYKLITSSEDTVSMVYETRVKDSFVMITFANGKKNEKIQFAHMVFHGKWSESNLIDFIVHGLKFKEAGEMEITDKIKCKSYVKKTGFFCVQKESPQEIIVLFRVLE